MTPGLEKPDNAWLGEITPTIDRVIIWSRLPIVYFCHERLIDLTKSNNKYLLGLVALLPAADFAWPSRTETPREQE